MSQFGSLPFGTDSGFGGPGLITILGVVAAAANEILVVFDVFPEADDPFGFDSAINPKNWTLTPIDPTITSTSGPSLTYVEKGKVVPTRTPLLVGGFVDEDEPTQIRLFTDSRLEQGVDYQLEVQPAVRGEDCEAFSGPTLFTFNGLKPAPSRRARFLSEDRFRDWDNTLFPTDPDQPESTWKLESNGDIALHEADASLKKRIMRRLLTLPGEFAHLPTYGATVRVKSLAKTGQVQALANSVAEQVREEPDVEAAAATAKIVTDSTGNAIIQLQVFAKRREQRDVRFLFEFPPA